MTVPTPQPQEAARLAEEAKSKALKAVDLYAKVYFWTQSGLIAHRESEQYETARLELFSAIDALAALAQPQAQRGQVDEADTARLDELQRWADQNAADGINLASVSFTFGPGAPDIRSQLDAYAEDAARTAGDGAKHG